MFLKNTTYYRKIYLSKLDKPFCSIDKCKRYKAYGYKYCIGHSENFKKTGNPNFSIFDLKNKSLPKLLQSIGTKLKKGVIGRCLICKKEYYVSPKERKTKKYCSQVCQHEGLKTNTPIECKICGSEIYVAKSTMKYRPRRTCSDKCYRIFCGRLRKGSKSNFWRGGVSSKRRKIRYSGLMAMWRNKVFSRDKYICQRCFKKGGYLEAHHIKQFAQYPKQRFVIKNGLTLCKKCHKSIHNEKKYQKNIN